MFLFINETLRYMLHLVPIQIHLMFLFIKQAGNSIPVPILFKYISCSYLSHSYCYLITIVHHSNTSHVLIYLFLLFLKLDFFQFKYISCSYLSLFAVHAGKFSDIQIHLMFLFITCSIFCFQNICKFKYISCSYLSAESYYNDLGGI